MWREWGQYGTAGDQANSPLASLAAAKNNKRRMNQKEIHKVKRFIFISSAKVKELNNDNEHILNRIFKLHKGKDFYATSKFNAEKLLF